MKVIKGAVTTVPNQIGLRFWPRCPACGYQTRRWMLKRSGEPFRCHVCMKGDRG